MNNIKLIINLKDLEKQVLIIYLINLIFMKMLSNKIYNLIDINVLQNNLINRLDKHLIN